MRAFAAVLLASGIFANATDAPPQVKGLESAQNLGHDFWLLVIAEPSSSTFESIGHFEHCYFEQQDLGPCHKLSPSPSGRFAVFQRAETGLIMFFNARTRKSEVVISKFPGLLRAVTWSESSRQVTFLVGPSSDSEKAFSISFPSGA